MRVYVPRCLAPLQCEAAAGLLWGEILGSPSVGALGGINSRPGVQSLGGSLPRYFRRVPAGRANPGSGLKVGRQHRGKNKTALLTVISAFFSLIL